MVPCAKILETARRESVDLIGLSGLITPSLEEMASWPSEMEREGFTHAAPDRRRDHLAGRTPRSRSRRSYTAPVVHVLDASRAVGVARQPAERRPCATTSCADVAAEYADDPREQRSRAAGATAAARWRGARATGWPSTGRRHARPRPTSLGIRILDDYPARGAGGPDRLDAVLPDLGARGPLPRDPHRPDGRARRRGAVPRRPGAARPDRAASGCSSARAVFGFWPANAAGDDIELYADEERTGQLAVIHTLRQQMIKPPGRPNLALADFVAPRRRGVADYVGAFAVTAGHGLDDAGQPSSRRQHDDYSAILAKALADRLAEAFAERLHERVRREFWGYAPDESLDNAALIREAVPGHPSGARLSRLPGPHREAHPVRPARRRGEHRDPADRELRDAADRRGERLLLLASGGAATSAWARSGGTRWRTTRAARAWTSPRPSAGCRPNLNYER